LLDMSVFVDQSFLDKYGVTRGLASLATEKEMPIYDEIKKDKNIKYLAGGATQNSIRGAAWMLGALGYTGKVHMTGSISEDENGQILTKAATDAGVQTHFFFTQRNTELADVLS